MGVIVDTNVYLSQWPFRRLPGDEPSELTSKLDASGVTQAWVGSFDALLHRDLAAANERLAAQCRRYGSERWLAFGSVNPAQPDWQEDLRRCHEDHRMAGLRLHPGFHGYGLDHPGFAGLLAAAARRRMIIQIAVEMEDERTRHPLVRVPAVDVKPLAGLARAVSGVRLQLVNAGRVPPETMRELARAGVYTDFARIEGVHGLKRLVEDVGLERVVFGSFYPFFYWEAARLKLKESGLDEDPVLSANARRLLGDIR